MTALILGLVTASARNSFDAVDKAVKQSSTNVLALDRVLARYGPETAQIRKVIHEAIGARMEIVWPQDSSKSANVGVLGSGEWLLGTERLADAIHGLQPRNDAQRALQGKAINLAEGLLQERWLVTDSGGASIPMPFLVVLILWLMFIFTSFGLFAPRNRTVVTSLFVCALCVAGAVFLILEMDGPFDLAVPKVSPEPLRYAHAHLNQ